MIKRGIFCQYCDKEYKFSKSFNTLDKIQNEQKRMQWLKPSLYEKFYKDLIIELGDIELWSNDIIDLEREFYVIQNDIYGFVCIKVVHRGEIKNAYRYNTYAYYCGIKCDISDSKVNGILFLETYLTLRIDENSDEIIELKNRGFKLGREVDPGHFSFITEVKKNDPNLKIIEEHIEIDVNTL